MSSVLSKHVTAVERPNSEMNFDTPFLEWFSRYASVNEAKYNTGDIVMGNVISRRFSIGIDDEERTILGVPEYEMGILDSFPINKVSFAKDVMNRDWLVLCSPDLTDGRDVNPSTKIPTPMPGRIWIPVSIGLLDGWYGTQNDIYFCHTEIRQGMPYIINSTPFHNAPIDFIGNWGGIEKINDAVKLSSPSAEKEAEDIGEIRHQNTGNVVPELSLNDDEFDLDIGGAEGIDLEDLILP